MLVNNTITAPHFRYCSSILYLGTATNAEKLQRLQNKDMRVILWKNRYTPVVDMIRELNSLNVKQEIHHKVKNNPMSGYLGELLMSVNEVSLTNVALRKMKDLRSPPLKKALCRNKVFVKGVIELDKISGQIKSISSINVLKLRLADY